MARYSCVYSADGKLLELCPQPMDKSGKPLPKVWFRSSDPREADKFKVVDNVEISDAGAACMKQISRGGGGDGADKAAIQMVESEVIDQAALAKSIIEQSIAEVLALKPTVKQVLNG